MRLIDLEPRFVRYETRVPGPETGKAPSDLEHYLHQVDSVAEAQGIQFLCPSCFVKNGGDVGTHYIEVSFVDRGVADNEGSHNRDGKPSRWVVSGSGYSNLTTTPSILIDPALPACAGWHGFITDGEIK